MAFALDPRLAADTIYVSSLPVCELLIMNDARYPWAILVPRREGAREVHDVTDADADRIWGEVRAISRALSAWQNVEKINIGALGNLVPQLHIHIIGRTTTDPAWPRAVLGHSPRVPYGARHYEQFAQHLQAENIIHKI